MKFSKFALAAMAVMSMAGVAHADVVPGVKLTGDVHAATDYNFRGMSLSGNNPTLGFNVTATHETGLFASLDENTVNVSGINGVHQYLSNITVGYNTEVGPGIKLGGGVTRYQFNGPNSAADMTFNEVYAHAGWNGIEGAVYRNIGGAKNSPAAFAHGDTYASLGYTYNIDKFSLGGDVGYYWYDNDAAHNGVSLAQLRAGYKVNDNFSVGVAYQVDGHDAADKAQDRNHEARVNVGYSF
ncbi:uncharacterized protein NMK_2473 [Novimethylophilus kurashikiensis]|uniref:Porin n=1 Tax=Novimethylophilus kurashikiensis TaxID=1825523 RepID=A0A2R5F9F4_9PROT|nr:TorF family putative porin [Novimethylophilus kurashikiensis]GBG14872.1 uncharacterized protein NMK_2473 [Novimethylophilus kurashikiensis]